MRRKRTNSSVVGLDSLVDIVSNNVGIFIILTVFMALLSLLESKEEVPEKQETLLETRKVEIPWTHSSQKSGLWFLIQDNRLLFLDRGQVYDKLSERLGENNEPETHYSFEEYTVDLIALSSANHCLDFKPEKKAGEWWYQAKTLEQLMQKHPPTEFFFFFWVDNKSFELFHEVRAHLWENKFETGWKPVSNTEKITYCNGASRLMGFQPQ